MGPLSDVRNMNGYKTNIYVEKTRKQTCNHGCTYTHLNPPKDL